MKNDELDKLIDRSLVRLKEKATKDRLEAARDALILPSIKTSIKVVTCVTVAYMITGGLYTIGIKAPIFTLCFWTYPILMVFLMVLLVINAETKGFTNGVAILTFIFMIVGFKGLSLYEEFIYFLLESGYKVIVPLLNITIDLI